MPYYVYQISNARKLELIDFYDAYQDAKQAAVSMRRARDPHDADTVKIIFAHDQTEAEQLLSTKRERQPSDDD